MTTATAEHVVTIARLATQSLLDQTQRVEQTHAVNLADPLLGSALARTTELLEHAGYVESWYADEQHDIVDAHRRGLTVQQFRDRIDAAIAYAESPEFAQQVWERHGEEFGAAGRERRRRAGLGGAG